MNGFQLLCFLGAAASEYRQSWRRGLCLQSEISPNRLMDGADFLSLTVNLQCASV